MNHRTQSGGVFWRACLSFLILLSSAASSESLPVELLTTRGTVLTLEWRGSENAAGSAESDSHEHSIVLREDGSSETLTWGIPATEGEGIDLVGLFEHEELGLAFAVWTAWTPSPQGDVARLHIAAHDGREWVAKRTLPENGAAVRGSLDVAVTRTPNLDGSLSAVLHVAWSSSVPGGSVYLPLVLNEQLEVVEPFILTELMDHPGAEEASVGVSTLLLAESSDLGFVHLGVSEGEGRSLRVFRIEPLPEEIRTLADDARAQISIMGATSPSREDLAAEMRAFVFERARRLHPALQSYVSHRVELLVAEWDESLDSQGLERLGSDARAQISIMGSRIGPGGLDAGADLWLLESLGADVPSHLLSSMASWRRPEEVPAGAELLMSGDGRRVLLVWETDKGVDLVLGAGEDWSDLESLEGGVLDQRMRLLLQRRVEWSSEMPAASDLEE